MDDILVEVFIPAAHCTYDVIIPRKCMMWEITKLVAKGLSDISEGMYIASDNAILCDRISGTVFNINLSVEELGLTNGSQLMLI